MGIGRVRLGSPMSLRVGEASVSTAPLVVVLAGGNNTRFWPLKGKSLLRFCGRTLIEHQIDAFAAAGCDHAVVVTSPDTEASVREAVARYGDRVTIAVQREAKGMGDALLVAEAAVGPGFDDRPIVVTQSHDVVEPDLYARLLAAVDSPVDGAIAGQETATYFPGGYLALHGERITAVVEKPPPGSEPSRFVNLVIHLHKQPRRLVDAVRAMYQSENQRDDHYERALTLLSGELHYRLVPYSDIWQPIKYPWHVLGAMELFLKRLRPMAGPPRPGISGTVVLEDDVVLYPGAVVVGPSYIGSGVRIGNASLVRGSMVGRDTDVGYGCEVARSYVGDRCFLHHSYVGDSVLEGDVGFGFGTVTGNNPFYPPPVRASVRGERMRTEMEKLGAIVGSRVRTGIGVLLNPGVKVGSDTFIGPGVVVAKDVKEHQLLLIKQEIIERENPFDYIPPRP
jgi:UDP-N-acetylglucosamine diphosphorylase / glucose-1-phosphate thymidylyltransferase / UDP-N-acetylgalactosamine diphosphorylase / glucosamine-1-phosphate N-acetyltransferase / galactosamine-1-phosphate N-acetyltransferase